MLALLGGWAGAKLAQGRFRHKTRKEPFRSLLNLSVLGPVALMAGAVLVVTDPILDAKVSAVTAELVAVLMPDAGFWPDAEGWGDGGRDQNTVTVRRGSEVSTFTVGD